jgi:hypothetical protein
VANTTVQVITVFDRFPELAGWLRQRAGQLARENALAIRDGYRQNAREDTGAQKASAYIVTNRNSTYAEAAAAAREANPGVELLPEASHPDVYTALTAVGAVYSAVNEFGGHGRVGDGAMTRAAEAQRQPFMDAMRKLLDFQT